MLLWTANEEHVRAAEADGLAVYKSEPTQDATETAPPSTSVAVTYSSSRPASGAASLRRSALDQDG